MDIYLPADFYELRDDLNDWRDAGTSADVATSAESDASVDEADPSWRAL